MPPTLLDAATYRDKAVGRAHWITPRQCLWFNLRVLRDAGIAPSGPGYTWQNFASDLAKVAASGRIPLCLGGKDRFTATELFENTLLGSSAATAGPRSATTHSTGRGSQLKDALTRFGEVVSRADPSAGGLTWDQAVKKLATGRVRIPVDERFRLRRSRGRTAPSKARTSDTCPTREPRARIWRSWTPSSCRLHAKDGLNAIKFLETIADPKTSSSISTR